MATNWKTLSEEQKQAIKEKKRVKYAALPKEDKQKLIDAVTERRASLPEEQKEEEKAKRRLQCPKQYFVHKSTGNVTITDPSMVALLWKLDKRQQRRKAAFDGRMKEIQEWRDAGGLFPWPNLKKKMHATQLFLQAKVAMGGRCANCGTDEGPLEWCWRISPKTDFLAFVGSSVADMERVLAAPDKYEMHCLHCAMDLKLYVFAWIFSPYSLRNGGRIANPFGPKYPSWPEKMLWMYPIGNALFDRIDSGEIKSLKHKLVTATGKVITKFLRKVHYYSTIGSYPRKLAWTELKGYCYGDTRKTDKQSLREAVSASRGSLPEGQEVLREVAGDPRAGELGYQSQVPLNL